MDKLVEVHNVDTLVHEFSFPRGVRYEFRIWWKEQENG